MVLDGLGCGLIEGSELGRLLVSKEEVMSDTGAGKPLALIGYNIRLDIEVESSPQRSEPIKAFGLRRMLRLAAYFQGLCQPIALLSFNRVFGIKPPWNCDDDVEPLLTELEGK